MADNALNMDMGSYTQHKYQDMINEAAEDYDSKDDFTALLEKINSDDFFEPFSARLLRYLSKHEGIDFSPEKAARFLRGKLEVAEANISRNTVNNWLNVSGSSAGSTGPRLGDEGREAMFQVAFALGLTTAETEDYFHRVFLDKAFNARNVKEFVYFYCIQHGKLYSQA